MYGHVWVSRVFFRRYNHLNSACNKNLAGSVWRARWTWSAVSERGHERQLRLILDHRSSSFKMMMSNGSASSLLNGFHARGHHSRPAWENTPRTIFVEGNIGSGKTTLLNYFAQFPQTVVLPEPVEKWTNFYGENILNLLYTDPKRWSFAFQTCVYLSMAEGHAHPQTAPVKLMERSLYTARHCFVENLYNSGNIQDAEYHLLVELYDFLINKADAKADLIVYLYTEPEVALSRIKARNRKEEASVRLDLVKKLHFLHERWLKGKSGYPLPAPVLVVDANKPVEEMLVEYKKLEDIILGTNGKLDIASYGT